MKKIIEDIAVIFLVFGGVAYMLHFNLWVFGHSNIYLVGIHALLLLLSCVFIYNSGEKQITLMEFPEELKRGAEDGKNKC